MESARKNYKKSKMSAQKERKKAKMLMISEMKREKETYEKARMLKEYIENIRAAYTKDFTSEDGEKRQMAVATYLVDKLCLRAGNDTDDDEIDTVECCKLKVENVKTIPPNTLEFNFLVKDSIRCENTVDVELPVYKAIEEFLAGKNGSEGLFDKLENTSKLNAHLEGLMPGLTGKVFRTYNACITLDEILNKETPSGAVSEKAGVYSQATREVAIICNFQRTVARPGGVRMYWLKEYMSELQGTLTELKTDLDRAVMGLPPLRNSNRKPNRNLTDMDRAVMGLPPLRNSNGKRKRTLTPEELERTIAETIQMIEKLEQDMRTQENQKYTSVGMPKIKYLDPRIAVAWCKRNEVPINMGTLTELKTDLDRAVMGLPPLRISNGKLKRTLTPEELERTIAETIQMIEKLEQDMRTQENQKYTSVGMPKIKYLDPRITVAWCKRNEVPIDKIYTEYYMPMFEWAMDADIDFRF